MKRHSKRPKRILVWKASNFWRQNAKRTTEKFLKELLNNQERKHRKTWSKKCRDGYNTAYTKKATSWTISERNSPNKASRKAKFLKNCCKSNEDFTCKISGEKSFKNAKKRQQTLRKLIAYLYGMKKHEKRRKRIFVWKPSQFRRQNANQMARSYPYTSLEGMANCKKLGVLYTRIGLKVRVSHYNRSAIFFSQLCFFSRAKQSWGPTESF